jgi:hypothetical protein
VVKKKIPSPRRESNPRDLTHGVLSAPLITQEKEKEADKLKTEISVIGQESEAAVAEDPTAFASSS